MPILAPIAFAFVTAVPTTPSGSAIATTFAGSARAAGPAHAAGPPGPAGAASPTGTPAPGSSSSIEQAIRKQRLEDTRPKDARPSAAPQTLAWRPPTYNDGRLYQEITVTDWFNSFLILPEFRPAKQPIKGFGVPRGGSRGSPSFDAVTRKYWWE